MSAPVSYTWTQLGPGVWQTDTVHASARTRRKPDGDWTWEVSYRPSGVRDHGEEPDRDLAMMAAGRRLTNKAQRERRKPRAPEALVPL